MRTGKIHAATIDNSPRLRRAVKLLADGKEHSGMDICIAARTTGLTTLISELRANFLTIRQRYDKTRKTDCGHAVSLYRLDMADMFRSIMETVR